MKEENARIRKKPLAGMLVFCLMVGLVSGAILAYQVSFTLEVEEPSFQLSWTVAPPSIMSQLAPSFDCTLKISNPDLLAQTGFIVITAESIPAGAAYAELTITHNSIDYVMSALGVSLPITLSSSSSSIDVVMHWAFDTGIPTAGSWSFLLTMTD